MVVPEILRKKWRGACLKLLEWKWLYLLMVIQKFADVKKHEGLLS